MMLRKIALAASFALVGVGAAFAQSSTVVIQPEQEMVIREHIKKEPLVSLNLPGFEFNIGSKVPDTVELREVPEVQYRYVVVDGRTVLVDPQTRQIVYVLQ